MVADASSDPVVVLSGVSKRFGEVAAVDRVSLQIGRGQIFGFLGPNGAGKTTTIKLLLGLLLPDAGRIRILGLDPLTEDTRLKQCIGYVPEDHHVHRWMRVSEAATFCQAFYANWNNRRYQELLERFQLDARKKVRDLSKGMATKLSLVLALAHDPELLILDEPTSGLDPIIREELLDCVLRMVCDAGPTVIFSSHMMSDIQRLADRVGILCDGKLLVEGPLDELLATTKRVRAVLRDDQASPAPPEGTVFHRRTGREWLLTVHGFDDAALEALRATTSVDALEVLDVALEDLFKDFVKGQRNPSGQAAGVAT